MAIRIPQREEAVSLEAPRTQAGTAVSPVSAAMGTSYIEAMQGLSKSLGEISELQSKLALSSMQTSVNQFHAFAEQRTQQLAKDLSMATTNEMADKLYADYQSEISKTGLDTLGSDLYNGWFDRKGGTLIAGAQYSNELAKTQLMINNNKVNIGKIGDNYATQAFTAKDAETRNKYADEYSQVLDEAVTNGIYTQGEADKIKNDWNHKLTSLIVEEAIAENPDLAIKNLRQNKDYAPILSIEERLRFISNAEAEKERNKGTKKDAIVKAAADFWVPLYEAAPGDGLEYTTETKDGKQSLVTRSSSITYKDANGKEHTLRGDKNNLAYQIYNISRTATASDLRYIMSAMTGVPVENIDTDTARAFRDYMRQDYIDQKDQPKYQNWLDKKQSVTFAMNNLGIVIPEDEDEKAKYFSVAKLGTAFKKKELGNNIKSISQLLDISRTISDIQSSNQTASYAVGDDYSSFNEKRDVLENMIVFAVENSEEDKVFNKLFNTDSMKEFGGFVKGYFDIIDTSFRAGETEQKKKLFIRSLSEIDLEKAFDKQSDMYFRNGKNVSFNNAFQTALKNSGLRVATPYATAVRR